MFAPAGQPTAARDVIQAPGGTVNVYNAPVWKGSPGTDAEPVKHKETKVFFLGASPYDIALDRIRADREFRAIQSVARPGVLSVVNRTAATVADLAHLLDERPHILHLSCHAGDGVLLFEDPTGEPHPIEVASLVRRMRAYYDHARFRLTGLVLSVCGSGDFATEFAGMADAVVGWRGDLDDDCAIEFAKALYRMIGGESALSLGDAARVAAVEVAESGPACARLADQLVVFPP